MFFTPSSSFHTNSVEKQFVVNFISSMCNQPFNYIFEYRTFYSNEVIEMEWESAKRFLKAYEVLGMRTGSKLDDLIANVFSETFKDELG